MKAPGPLISIVVPVYNAERYLAKFCESVVEQTYRNFEVLMHDDGCTDNSREIIMSYARDPRFRCFSWDRNQGLNRTWHNLLTQVTGDYWCSPGADDVLKPSFLERRLRVLEQTPEAVFAHGPPEVIDTAGERCRSLPKSSGTVRLIEARQGLLHSLRCNHINQPGVLVRSCSARLRLSLFERDWKYAPDWFLWILLLAEGKKVVWDPEPLYQYRVHGTSLSLDPGKKAVRLAEERLVPLCGLAAASSYSPLAAQIWREWRTSLYHLWLRRASKLYAMGQLRPDWVKIGSIAYHGDLRGHSLGAELAKHALGVLKVSIIGSDGHPHQNGLGYEGGQPAGEQRLLEYVRQSLSGNLKLR